MICPVLPCAMLAVAQRRSLFDDPAEEINEMTAIIKQSITHLNTEVNDLKSRSADAAASNTQTKQHSAGVVNSLHATLKKTTSEFMRVVKARRQVSVTGDTHPATLSVPGFCIGASCTSQHLIINLCSCNCRMSRTKSSASHSMERQPCLVRPLSYQILGHD